MQDGADRAMDRAQAAHESRPKRKTNRRANTATTSFDNSVNNKRRNYMGTKMAHIFQNDADKLYRLKIEIFCNSLLALKPKTESPFPVTIGDNKSLPPIEEYQAYIPQMDSANYRWRFVPNEIPDDPGKAKTIHVGTKKVHHWYFASVTGSPPEPKYESKETYPEGVWA